MPTPKEIQKLSYEKAVRLEKIIDEVEKRIRRSSSALTKSMLKLFLNKLSAENGRIIASFDRETTTLFNQAYKSYSNTAQQQLARSILADINNILEDNDGYYKNTTKRTIAQKEIIKRIVNRRLGINADGKLINKGFMSSLLDDAGLKSDLQKHIFKEVFRGTGPEALRKSIKTYIEGDKNRLGTFEKYYKTFSYDVYAQISSYTGALYANELGLRYFIYNGGLIETSREFCRKKNGNVYSNDEGRQWVDDPTLTAIPSKASYSWFIDRGGYNCRHFMDFIAKEVAFVLRPELNDTDPDQIKEVELLV